MLDGQQRITSFGRFVTGKFAIKDEADNVQYFSGLPEEQRQRILQSPLLIYECEGEEKEIKEWFKTINIVGIPLKEQELLNAIYSGKFVNAAKRVFSNSQNAETQKWSHYIKGDVKRQDYLAEALKWICNSKGMSVDAYMSQHRHDIVTGELESYFRSVIDWISSTFTMVEHDMCGLEWGRLYETYHTTPYSIDYVTSRIKALQVDESVRCSRNIYEYVLGGEIEKKLLDIRIFEESTKRTAYKRQTEQAEKMGISNCPLCALGDNANRTRIYKLSEMDADHVTAWSKGGTTNIKNCEMLCKTHNRSKGNK
ncbi:MAG: HNH endonuclease signature motif containing protein [Bacteroidaceae bacterium]|nr:HNH endonuclease signature motif containing protein [Bacteroidaceae bacterium]